MSEPQHVRKDAGHLACASAERMMALYAFDELDGRERTALEAHVAECAACAASLASELRLYQALQAGHMAESLDPSGRLLAQCRSELEEAIDDQESRVRPAWLEWLRSRNWLAGAFIRHPVLSAAALIVLGVLVGSLAPRWIREGAKVYDGRPIEVRSFPRLSEQDLETIGIAGINFVSDGSSASPRVELHLTSQKPLILEGGLDDTDVKRVLTFVVQNGQRFDPGVRLDSLDVLRMRNNDREVRQTLCAAARHDRNPGVRLKALEALRGFEQQDDAVRQTLLDTLVEDENPGVRVEAINILLGALGARADKGTGPEDDRVVHVLRDRMHRDPNNYIRMQSAAAIRQWGAHELH